MFNGCYNLTDISGLSNWDTSNVTDMGYIFYYCYNLTDISALSNWNVSKVDTLIYAFTFVAMTNLNALSSWDVSSVTCLNYTFRDCKKLTDVSGINNWNIKSLKYAEKIFGGLSIYPTWKNGTWSNGTFTPTS